MNILLFSHTFLPKIGGRELVVHYLARSLTQLGHKVRVVGPAQYWRYRAMQLEYPVHRNINIFRARFGQQGLRSWLRDKELLTYLLANISIWGCDIIHAHTTYPTGWIAAQAKKIKNIPLVITPHGVDIHMIPELEHGMRLNPLLEPKISFALTNADAITAISTGIEESLLDAGTNGNKIYRVPNGVDLERFKRPNKADVYSWLKLPRDSKLIVTVGNYHPRKGHEVLIRSMIPILMVEPRARLTIVGKKTDAMIPLIRKLGLEGKVVLTGAIQFPGIITNGSQNKSECEPDWLAAILATSEVYVSSGTDEGAEGLSLAILEAMAAGLPVVATDISGNKDIIHNGETGFLVPPNNPTILAEHVLKLMGNIEKRTHMRINCKKKVEKYGWNEIASQYITVYQEVHDQCRQ